MRDRSLNTRADVFQVESPGENRPGQSPRLNQLQFTVTTVTATLVDVAGDQLIECRMPGAADEIEQELLEG